jgi:flagellar basal body-associated protein FliL
MYQEWGQLIIIMLVIAALVAICIGMGIGAFMFS